MSRPRSARVTQERVAEIGGLAEEVAVTHHPGGRIEPKAIAEAASITLSFNSYGEAFDGMLEHLKGKFHIYCNLERVGNPRSPRARFTIAHELGHYYIDEHRNEPRLVLRPAHGSLCEYESKNLAEQEADLFASNLLMPLSRFLATARTVSTGMPGVLKLAETFGTSVTSTAIRYAGCDLVPCVVLKWNPDGFAWKWVSTEAFRARLIKTVESKSELPTDSATGRALADEKVPSKGYFECGTTAAGWFQYVSHDAERNPILMEHAMPLGRFGVLTILYPESGHF